MVRAGDQIGDAQGLSQSEESLFSILQGITFSFFQIHCSCSNASHNLNNLKNKDGKTIELKHTH